MHCPYYICERKFYARTQVKNTRHWKSTLSDVCKAAPIFLFCTSNGLNHAITGSAFRIFFHLDWQIDDGFLNRPMMVRTQICDSGTRVRAQNKEFGAVLQTDLTTVYFLLWRSVFRPETLLVNV